jgi:hypothetical protein
MGRRAAKRAALVFVITKQELLHRPPWKGTPGKELLRSEIPPFDMSSLPMSDVSLPTRDHTPVAPTSIPSRHAGDEPADTLDLDVEQADGGGRLRRIRRRTVAEVVDHIRQVLAQTEAGRSAEHDTVRLPLDAPFPPAHHVIVHSRAGANEGDFIDVRALYYPEDEAEGVGRTWAVYTCKSYGAQMARKAAGILADTFWCYGQTDIAADVWSWWHRAGALQSTPAKALGRLSRTAAFRRAIDEGGRTGWLLELPRPRQRSARQAIHALGWPIAIQALGLPARWSAPAGCEPAGAYTPTRSFE